ncbi:MAG: mechanosensitive ion channel domain-containing protein [Verrucomicrobiota bacterium]
MDTLLTRLTDTFTSSGLDAVSADLLARGLALAGLVVLAWAFNFIAKQVLLRVVTAIIQRSSAKWDDALVESGFFSRISHIAPALVINFFGDDVLGRSPEVLKAVNTFVNIYLIIIMVMVLMAFLGALEKLFNRSAYGAKVPIKGFAQAIKLVMVLMGLVFVLSQVLGRSPLYFLSGLGAVMAVLLLVFKDAILGFVAGIQISVNQLVRVGDWIEMPKAGADGDVIDVALTTVKVRNWDKTITTIPTYALISESFKNWRGMQEMGGRRIKRALLIDMSTIRFADEDQLHRWEQIRLLKPYLTEKLKEIAEENRRRDDDLGVLGNGRRLTNLGTFRAYCVAYLKANPRIHQDMTFLVRQLQPTEHGLPLEIYVFTNDTRWAVYEGIQADIFDHLLAVIDQFGLAVFQQPAGRDLRGLVTPSDGGLKTNS